MGWSYISTRCSRAELVDGDGIAETSFADALMAAEAIRLDPTSTPEEPEAQKDILERINLMDQ